jgi:hypothetical protein
MNTLRLSGKNVPMDYPESMIFQQRSSISSISSISFITTRKGSMKNKGLKIIGNPFEG